MCSLHEILAHGTGLPASLMAQRRAAFIVAVDRYWGDTFAPMPSVDAAGSKRSGRFKKRLAA